MNYFKQIANIFEPAWNGRKYSIKSATALRAFVRVACGARSTVTVGSRSPIAPTATPLPSPASTWPVVLRGIVLSLARNPMILAILAGVALSALGLKLPLPAARAIELLGSTAAPVALFYIGGTLAGLKVKIAAGDIGLIVAGKLLLHPLLVYLAFLALPLDGAALQTAAVLNACMPMMSIYPILAQKYGQEGLCAAALVATTVTSFFTISGFLWLSGAGGYISPPGSV